MPALIGAAGASWAAYEIYQAYQEYLKDGDKTKLARVVGAEAAYALAGGMIAKGLALAGKYFLKGAGMAGAGGAVATGAVAADPDMDDILSPDDLMNMMKDSIEEASEGVDKLILALRTLKDDGIEQVTWDQLNKIMDNVGASHVDEESFATAYDNNPELKQYVDRFSSDGITMAGASDPMGGEVDADNTVDNMAKRATDKALD